MVMLFQPIQLIEHWDIHAMKRIFSSNLVHLLLSNQTIRNKNDVVIY